MPREGLHNFSVLEACNVPQCDLCNVAMASNLQAMATNLMYRNVLFASLCLLFMFRSLEGMQQIAFASNECMMRRHVFHLPSFAHLLRSPFGRVLKLGTSRISQPATCKPIKYTIVIMACWNYCSFPTLVAPWRKVIMVFLNMSMAL